MNKFISTMLIAVCLLLAACPGDKDGTGSGTDAKATMPKDTAKVFDPSNANVPEEKDPFPHYLERPYTEIHADARQAWYLVETSYLVIKDKYEEAQKLKNSSDPEERRQGEQLYNEVATEVQNKIFGTNPTVEALFKSAIEAEPDNPLNYATYAVYLKPRKRFSDEVQFENTETEAVEMLDKAIELWPDDPRFVYMKIFTLTEPHQAHEWMRAAGLEIDAIRMRVKQVSDLYDQLEKLDPQNAFVNYSRALFIAKVYAPEFGDSAIDEMVRELRKGNAKPRGRFYYPPPLPPFAHDARLPKLYANQNEPVWVDQWLHWGNLDPFAVNQLVRLVDGRSTWPGDKKDIGEVMYALYALGRLEPFERTFFNLQLKCLHRQQDSLPPDSPEKVKLAEATRFLNDQYMTVATRMYKDGLIEDETRLGVLAIEDMETSPLSGKKYMHKYMQGPQAAYLKRAGEILGLEFPLPEDPEKW